MPANPRCPRCGRTMPGGVPHGAGTVQYECRACNVYQTDDRDRYEPEPDDDGTEPAHVGYTDLW